MIRIIFLSVAIAILVSAAGAESVLPFSDPTLEQLITQLRTKHPDFQAMDQMIAATEYRSKMERGWMNPMFKTGVMNIPAKSMKIDKDPMTMMTIGVMQTIPMPWRIRAVNDRGEARKSTIQHQRDWERSEMSIMLIMSYYDYVAAKSSYSILVEFRKWLIDAQSIASAMQQGGMGNFTDVAMATAELAEWDRQIEDEKSKVESNRASIEALTNTSFDEQSPVVLPDSTLILPPLSEFIQNFETSPAMKLASAQLTESKRNLQVARSNWIPEIETMFQYGYRAPLKMTESTTLHDGTVVKANSTVKQDAMLSAEVTIPLPLFWHSNQHAMIQEETAMKRAKEFEKDATYKKWEESMRRDYAKAARLVESTNIYRNKILPARKAAFETAFANYRNGNVQFMTVSETIMKYAMSSMEERMTTADACATIRTLQERSGK